MSLAFDYSAEIVLFVSTQAVTSSSSPKMRQLKVGNIWPSLH